MLTSKYGSAFLYVGTIPPIYGGCGEGSEDLFGVPAEVNNFFRREKGRINVHSLTQHRFVHGFRAPTGKNGHFYSYNYRKVSVGEHLFYIVFIYLIFIEVGVNVARARRSLSER